VYECGGEVQVNSYDAEVELSTSAEAVTSRMRLIASGVAYYHATQQSFLDVHELDFLYFGGVFRHLRCDDLRSARKEILPTFQPSHGSVEPRCGRIRSECASSPVCESIFAVLSLELFGSDSAESKWQHDHSACLSLAADTELVVLSACETGTVEVRNGEGVFGLRRSFSVAGARTVVMSLWKVDDAATTELMEQFYCNLLQGQGRRDALRSAQKEIRRRWDDPFYWGAFILQGDPSPLPGILNRK